MRGMLSVLMVSALLPALSGCRDSELEALTELAERERASGGPEDSRDREPPLTTSEIEPSDRPSRELLAGGIGSVEWSVDEQAGRLEILLRDMRDQPLTGVENAVLWFADSGGPRQRTLEPCRADRPACFATDLPDDTGGWEGILRFELGGRRHRAALSAPRTGNSSPGETPRPVAPPADTNDRSTNAGLPVPARTIAQTEGSP